MRRFLVRAFLAMVALALLVPTTSAVSVEHRSARPVPGSPSAGDPYFPHAGNGGYDVQHYTLDLAYRPSSNRLAGMATVDATALQALSRFNLDLSGLRVASVVVNDQPARWSRDGQELRIRPAVPLRAGDLFRTVVKYAGVPRTIGPESGFPGFSGFFHTDDGSLVVGQPKVAATWFPVNDHPSDKASYTFRISAPQDRRVVANGELVGKQTEGGWTTWHWEATEPMASYLATASVGRWRFFERDHGDVHILDAVDSRMMRPFTSPRTGEGFAWSAPLDGGYQRLTRTISVPPEGARLSFSLSRDIEPGFDFFAVEARTAGQDDWTTLPDLRGHTRRATGPCPPWLELHPFLDHYMTPRDGGEGCRPRGSTGQWHAASGTVRDYERWTVDLSAYAGTEVQVALTVVNDEAWAHVGAFVDDIRVSSGAGTTSFEEDGNTADGWHAAAAPAGSPPQDAGWTIGPVGQAPERAALALRSLGKQGEILDFLEGYLGPYPFSQAGGIVDRNRRLFFALENQTRPVYARGFFVNTFFGDTVVVHELAHQWVGDSLTVQQWRHIWLNEGFATYAEWLWWDHIGYASPQEVFDNDYRSFGRRDPFWEVKIGDPGKRHLFDFPVYERGAMTLQALRMTVGDDAFFEILRRWVRKHEGGLVRTGQFVRLAERVADRPLDRLFHRWLFVTERPPRPAGPEGPAGRSRGSDSAFVDKLFSGRG